MKISDYSIIKRMMTINTIPRNMTSGYVKFKGAVDTAKNLPKENANIEDMYYTTDINEIFESFIRMKLVKE